MRPKSLEAESRVELKAGDARAPKSVSGQGESSSEKTPIAPGSNETVSVALLGKSSPAKSLPVSELSPEEEEELEIGSSKSSFLGEVPSFLVEVMPEMDPDLEPVPGKVATRHPSPKKGMLWRGFLL